MIFNKILHKLRFKIALKNGLTVGKNCKLGRINFGSEPWLIEIGNNVYTSSNIVF